MSARVLAVVRPGEEAAALGSLTGLATLARAAGAEVRLVYLRDMPRPRVDHLDHVVADTDQEMARIAASVRQAFEVGLRRYDDVKSEIVVRFGTPSREAALEAEAYAPQIVIVFAVATDPVSRLRDWALRRRLTRDGGARVLVLQAEPERPTRRRTLQITRPALLPARRD